VHELYQKKINNRYLEQPELALFCESLDINCVVFGLLRGQGRRQNYTPFYSTTDKSRPYAVFVNTQGGNHYELIVKKENNHKFSLLLESSDMEILQEAHGQPGIESPPGAWFQNYEFVSDLVSFDAGSKAHKKRQK
jgi:hypothetical protein